MNKPPGGQDFAIPYYLPLTTSAQLVSALEDPELNGEVQGLKMAMELLASTEIVNQINVI